MRRAPSIIQSLPARLILLLTIALLPLALISISQTQQIVSEADRRSNNALLAKVTAAAAEEKAKIQAGLGAAQGLAAALPNAANTNACSKTMRDFVAENPSYVFAGYVPRDGLMTCSTSPEPVDFSGFPGFEEFFETGEATVVVNPTGTVSQRPVFIVTTPVRSGDAVVGFVSVSIPLEDMATLLASVAPGEPGLALATVNQVGDVLVAEDIQQTTRDLLPKDQPLSQLFLSIGDVFTATAADGTARSYAVTTVIDDQVLLIGSWPENENGGAANGLLQKVALALPLLSWLVGIAVAYFGLHRFVVRHISALQHAMGRFAAGERNETPLALEAPPFEFAETETAFNHMANIVTRAEKQQRDDLQQKEVLLKEVHHRVKNNLQQMTSIINMLSREAEDGETRDTLAYLQQRIRGLATLHRTHFRTPEVTTVNGADLVRVVVEDVSQAVGFEHERVDVDLQNVELTPDQAVPLSMLLSEALANASKNVGAYQLGVTDIKVSLEANERREVLLKVENQLERDTTQLAPRARLEQQLSAKLMAAFVAQLEGVADVHTTGTHDTYSVSFNRRDFEPTQQPVEQSERVAE